jgi:hypothetical protein
MTETEKIADVVVAAVRAATAPLLERIAALESRAPIPGPPGKDGQDATSIDREQLKFEIDQWIAPKVMLEIEAAIAAIEKPKDGRDGIDGKDAPAVDLDEIAVRAAALVPRAKDGVDGKDGRDGQPGVPGVPGRDGSAGERGEKGLDGSAGRDGTLEGASLKQLDDRTWQILRMDGSILGEMKSSAMVYRGIYRSGDAYEKGDVVTRDGSLWVAREDTLMTPGQGATPWQLAAKAGRDGREGKPGPQGLNGAKGERGEAGRNFS